MWKQFLSDYFNFTKKERTGVAVISTCIVLFALAPYTFPYFSKPVSYSTKDFEAEIALLRVREMDSSNTFTQKEYQRKEYASSYRKAGRDDETIKEGELFAFDPNTLGEEGWQRLGVGSKTIATIRKYLAKGGKFYKPEDLGKIWGLRPGQVERLIPLVEIQAHAKTFPKGSDDPTNYEKKRYKPSIIDINTADTAALIALPGIGSKLANRILTFREKLGGFYQLEQVSETFGLPDSVFQMIKPRLHLEERKLRQININSAPLEELKAHPYLRFALANAIVQYRQQHGKFSSINDLKKIMILSEEVLEKVAPYLTLADQ